MRYRYAIALGIVGGVTLLAILFLEAQRVGGDDHAREVLGWIGSLLGGTVLVTWIVYGITRLTEGPLQRLCRAGVGRARQLVGAAKTDYRVVVPSIGLLVFGVFVWPTPYEVHRGPRGTLFHVTRFTGHAERVEIRGDLPELEIERLRGEVQDLRSSIAEQRTREAALRAIVDSYRTR
jgi:hypothetical protein